MEWCLFLDLNVQEWYGDVPEIPENSEGRVEIYAPDEELRQTLLEQFVLPVNNVCGTCLDNGDVDFFDKEKCVKLAKWLEEQLAGELDPRLREPYGKLLEFARRAVELGTGVVVEM